MSNEDTLAAKLAAASDPAHAAAAYLGVRSGYDVQAFAMGFLSALEVALQFSEWAGAAASEARNVQTDESNRVPAWPGRLVRLFPITAESEVRA